MTFRSHHLALCLTAAAVPLLAGRAASAAVVTRSVNAMLVATPDGPNNTYDLDLDQDGTTDFTFTTIIGVPEDPTFASFATIDVPFASVNGEVVDPNPNDQLFPTVSRLSPGGVVGTGSNFSAQGAQGNLYFVTLFDPPSGNFDNAAGYVGFQFAAGTGETLFGFAYVTVNDLFDPVTPLGLTIGQVGYETVAGRSVTLPAVPEPAAGSALLAIAAATVGRRRRR